MIIVCHRYYRGACGEAVKTLDLRSRGLGSDSCSADHVCKALSKLWIHTASVHPAVMGTWCTIQGWINSDGRGDGVKSRLNMRANYKPVPLSYTDGNSVHSNDIVLYIHHLLTSDYCFLFAASSSGAYPR